MISRAIQPGHEEEHDARHEGLVAHERPARVRAAVRHDPRDELVDARELEAEGVLGLELDGRARVAAVDGVGGCRMCGERHRERALLRLGGAVGILAGACDDLAQLDVIRDVLLGRFIAVVATRTAARAPETRGGGRTWTPASDDRHVMNVPLSIFQIPGSLFRLKGILIGIPRPTGSRRGVRKTLPRT